MRFSLPLTSLLLALGAGPALAQVGTVTSVRKVAASPTLFPGLRADDGLGTAVADVASYGLASGGKLALAFGAPGDDVAGPDRGAVWLALLEQDGTFLSAEKLCGLPGSFDGVLHDGDAFGSAIIETHTSLPALYSTELFIGAPGDDSSGQDAGAVWWSFTDGSFAPVHTERSVEIAEGLGGFAGPLSDGDAFGSALTLLHRQSTLTAPFLVVGAPGDDDGGPDRGAVWVLTLDSAARQVVAAVKISSTAGGFTGALQDGDHFGASVTWVDDLDGDGSHELAVGAPGDDGGGVDRGAVWVLLLDSTGRVKSQVEHSAETGGCAGLLRDGDALGSALQGALGGSNGWRVDGRVLVGAPGVDDGGPDRGALWNLYLLADGSARYVREISATQGGFQGYLHDGDRFGAALDQLGRNGIGNLFPVFPNAVWAPGDDGGGIDLGALYGLGIYDAAPRAVVRGTPLVGAAPLTVAFDGTISSGYLTSWSWDFGDGTVSSAVSPTHVYTADGSYDVSLTVSSIDGASTDTQPGYVQVVVGGFAYEYGCGWLGGLHVQSGTFGIGRVTTVGLYNDWHTQGAGSLPFLALSAAPDPAYPCGTPTTAFTMSPKGYAAQLLLDLSPGVLLAPILSGAPWQGGYFPAPLDLPIPADPGLVGERVFAQGLLVDPWSTTGHRFGLTKGLDITIGP